MDKIYYTVSRSKIYEAMQKLGISVKITDLLKMTTKETINNIIIGVEIVQCQHQRDTLSAILFNLVLECAIKTKRLI